MTSLYGSQEIPISVYVMDYVTPEFYPKIEQGSKVEYYVGGSYSVSDDLLSFFNKKERIDNIKYTKIDIVAPSKYFADDLWISPSAPPKVILMDFVLNHSWIWGILLFAVISCLASLLAGSIVFRNDQPNKKHFALFGLFNFLTLIGFAIAAFVLKIDERFTKLKNEVKQKETSYKDAAKYVGAVLVGQLIVVGLVVLKIFDSLRGGLSDIVVVFFALPAIIVFVGLAIFFAFADKNAEFLVKNSKRLIKAATVYYVVEIVLFFFVIVLALSWAYNSPFFDLGEYVFFALFFIFSFLLATAIYKLIASGGNTMKLVSFVVLFSILFLVLLLGFWLVLGVLI
ncbi:MAG: hypothetical protein CVU81_02835 [Euryarchaeota archaeon HGW-Euryarchaeota-1]|nr:MAG: hypothetical protein CVU81_02835 [Euryarchaeota archaeon HGW-Euryarchaeota-1]